MSSQSGSALILVLLITALLATIAVSFLSTSRVEMIAAKNFTRQNAAAGLAESATQMAMAKIQQGFTSANGTATTIITTQPGAIRQFQFSGGNCSLVAEEELFSGTGNSTTNSTANLNNLQSPSSNSSAPSNQWTITGNASERINVFMENVTVTVNGTTQTVGRIAYYVDDEGTKLNLNAATGDRPTLNIGSSRSLSLSAVASANQPANFTQIINGNATSGNATSDVKNWAHFFRPEQVGGAVSGFDPNAIPNLSAAPTSGMDYHLKKTPWGTDRLFINDLPIDSTGVNDIYEALSGKNATTGNPTADQGLRNIYGTTFAEKYTDAGLKQIAANILQARDPNVLNDWNKSFTYNGSLLGATNATTDLVAIADCCDTANATRVIPKDYLGNAPYPILNEIGVTVVFALGNVPKQRFVRLQIRPFVSILNPWRVAFPKSEVDNWEIQYQIDSFRIRVSHEEPSGKINKIYGPTGYKFGDAWGHTKTEREENSKNRDTESGLDERYPLGTDYTSYSLNGTYARYNDYSGSVNVPSFSKTLSGGEELQFPCVPLNDGAWRWDNSYQLVFPEGSQILSIDNIVVKFEYIRLLAKSRDGTTIRDWILGEDLEVDGWLQNPHPTKGWAKGFPEGLDDLAKLTWFHVDYSLIKPPQYSIKRLDGHLKTAANMRAANRDSMMAWSESGLATWVNPNASGSASSVSTTGDAEAYPSETKDNEIPGDPTMTDSDIRYAYEPAEHHLDSNDWPAIQFTNPGTSTGVFTSPADFGKIQTNVQHRKLRFTTQHPKEVAASVGGSGNATYIPDWAMLDVISFGSNITTVPLPTPLNLNGSFHVPSGSPQPAPRTIGLESALKAIDSADLLGNPFNASSNPEPTNRSQYMGSSANVNSTVAGNIGNLTWSTGNFSAGSATWGKGNSTNDPGSRRKNKNLPVSQFVLPSEVTEIRGISDVVPLDNYTGNSTNIKANEGRLSSLFPGATTQSRFFTIYAFAQALDKLGQIDGEAVSKTLVEVEEQTPVTTPPTYKVKKLYTQPIAVP